MSYACVLSPLVYYQNTFKTEIEQTFLKDACQCKFSIQHYVGHENNQSVSHKVPDAHYVLI